MGGLDNTHTQTNKSQLVIHKHFSHPPYIVRCVEELVNGELPPPLVLSDKMNPPPSAATLLDIDRDGGRRGRVIARVIPS